MEIMTQNGCLIANQCHSYYIKTSIINFNVSFHDCKIMNIDSLEEQKGYLGTVNIVLQFEFQYLLGTSDKYFITNLENEWPYFNLF